ncbi:helix-turn-helix transcriptional regulator [Mycoplasmatota bacterium zrk1]
MTDLNDPKMIGSKIKELLSSCQMTQEQFAEEFYIDPRTIRRWIKEGINKLDVLSDIARFFEVDVKDILFR